MMCIDTNDELMPNLSQPQVITSIDYLTDAKVYIKIPKLVWVFTLDVLITSLQYDAVCIGCLPLASVCFLNIKEWC